MSREPRLPTIYHGLPYPEDEASIVQDALQEIVARLNQVPIDGDLPLRVIVSVLVSFCCAQDDPAAAFQIVGLNVGRGIEEATMRPEGNG